MLPAINLILFLFLGVAYGNDISYADLARTLTSQEQELWLRYLQVPTGRHSHSLITNPDFFLSPQGRMDPWAELMASVQELENPVTIGSREPLACRFPARKHLIEILLRKNYPQIDCPDLERWVRAFGDQKIWIIYAGVYRNNPASLFGHTFLRFDRQSEEDPSVSLRSQSVGFLAITPPEDGPTLTVIKGLLGLYQGAFNIQPYYMQTALYNNAEARSLWEFELDLTKTERKLAVLYMWEMGQQGSMVYRFFDENCSYHLLAFLEALRAGSALTRDSGFFVLPLETIRLLDKRGMIKQQDPVYRASIRTRLQNRLHKMTAAQRKLYRKARHELSVVETLDDIQVLDALIDYQTFHNYKQKTRLSAAESRVFEATFAKRAQLGNPSEELRLTNSKVSPLLSHKPAWWQAGIANQNLHLESQMGAHDLISSQKGLEDPSTMEYGGFKIAWDYGRSQLEFMEILLARARTFNSWSMEEPQFSWTLDGIWQDYRDENRWVRGPNTGAGGGMAWSSWNQQWTVAIMAEARMVPGGEWSYAQVGVGPWSLLRFENSNFVLVYEGRYLKFGSHPFYQNDIQLLPKVIGDQDRRVIFQWHQNRHESDSREYLKVSFRHYF